MIANLFYDFRHALRTLRASPAFMLVAVVTLALGIGATTAIFSVIDTVMLRPLPFADPARLVKVWETTPEGSNFSASDPNYLDFRSRNHTLEGVAAYKQAALNLSGSGEPTRLEGMAVTHSLFPLLGVAPAIGRTFLAEEDAPGRDTRVAVLSHSLWTARFGADPSVVGRVVTLDRQPYTVIGVMPDGFDFPKAEIWVPLAPDPGRDRDDHWLEMVGRLRPGATVQAAQQDLSALSRGIAVQHPEIAGWGVRVEPLSDSIVGPRFRQTMLVLLAGVGCLLLMACINLANLLFARATARETEIGVRAALGADRFRLVRQLLTESIVLALIGAGVGLLGARWALALLRSLAPAGVPRLDEIGLDGRMLAFTLALGLLTSVIFGLVPALRASRVELAETLRKGGRGAASGHRHTRDALVVIQVALAMVLLIGAGLLMRSFLRLQGTDPGFDTQQLAAVSIQLDGATYAEPWQRNLFVNELIERIEAIPGVTAAGATGVDPLSGWNLVNDVTPAERAAEVGPSGYLRAGWRPVTPGFFGTMGIPLVQGRVFSDSDPWDGPKIVVISRTIAQQLWPGESAVGKQLFWGGIDGTPRTVIGVVGDIRDVDLEGTAPPLIFVPNQELTWPAITVVVRSAGNPAGIAAAVHKQIRALDPTMPVPEFLPLERTVVQAAAGPRFRSLLIGGFALIALLLAGVGVYGVTAFGVARRTREFGVRLALGASPAEVSRSVVRRGAALGAAGVALGILGAWWVTRFLGTLLYRVSPTDEVTFVAVALLLGGVALLASYLPARRATRVDPMVALRAE
jgi:predicted permease